MVTAYFDEDGNICREHVESEDRGRRMTNDEVKTVLDEITPENELVERGKHKFIDGHGCASRSGHSMISTLRSSRGANRELMGLLPGRRLRIGRDHSWHH